MSNTNWELAILDRTLYFITIGNENDIREILAK